MRNEANQSGMNFTQEEHKMAKEGFAYLSKAAPNCHLRKAVSNLSEYGRNDIIFDIHAYEQKIKQR